MSGRFSSPVSIGDLVFIGDDDVVTARVTGVLFREHGCQIEATWWNGRSLEVRWIEAFMVRRKEEAR